MLLKNDGALPLGNYDKISVFGMNSVDLVYGGTGSAEKDSGDSVDLTRAWPTRASPTTRLKRFYDNQKAAGKRAAPRVPAWAIS